MAKMSRSDSCKIRALYHPTAAVCLALLAMIVLPGAARGQRAEYRAFWVDTFNTSLNNHSDVVEVVNRARAANANAIFAQVRRRGDSWYLNSLEPLADRTPIEPGFDPLQDLITEAHASGIEVHAFVISCAIWNRDPRLFPPESPNHAFNLHGGFDPASGTIIQGPDNWLTRTLLPDQGTVISFQGHRIGSDFWIDPGHPAAEAYTVDVLMHLVRNYDIDGLHLDRIRYPELSVSGQTPSTGANIGYNPTSIARFQRRYGLPQDAIPAPNDPLWAQWRRDQVSNLVRRIYLSALAIKPQLKITAALIAFGSGPASWASAEAYWRVYQDWRAWTEEGILDIAIPMNYKTEHTAAGRAAYDSWNEWTKNHQYNRWTMIGQGAFLNAVEGSLRQARRALAVSATGASVKGIIFYSMATSNVAVTANPFSIPPGQNTPARPFAEFAAGLTTGRSVDGTQLYEDPVDNPIPIFNAPASIPVMPWKASPTLGHVMGFARVGPSTPLDTASVFIENASTGAIRATRTDGGGFFGAVDLAPGQYRAYVEFEEGRLFSPVFTVSPGAVTRVDIEP
jgi:uncharacterized lipoprotein YddW (UPF0748 family)